MRKIYLTCLFIFIFSQRVFSQTIDLEPITVTYKEFSSRSINTLTGRYIESLPVHSVDEAVRFLPGIELKRRNSFGTQQDLSIRGSSFEDVDIRLDGIRVNDPQTGHFSMEIPFTIYDIEKIEVNKGTHTVDYRIKRPDKNGGAFRASFGQHALGTQTFSFNFGNDAIKNRLSVDHKASSGGRQDTDFDHYNFTFYSVLGEKDNELSFLYADQEKDFGASTFYSAGFPHQAETTGQRFFKLAHQLKKKKFTLHNALYFRRHYDRFLLDRHNPSFFENQHTTYVYGGQSLLTLYDAIDIHTDIAKEKLTSTSLGNHSRIRKTAGIRVHPAFSDFFFIEAGNRFIHSQGTGGDMEWNAKLGFLPQKGFEIDFIYNRLIRTPSFTELYYNSPANIGDSSLDPEKINNFEIMASVSAGQMKFHAGIFLKDYFDTIDWVKNAAGAPWRARNIGDNTAKGIECGFIWKIDNPVMRNISTNYTYLHSADKEYHFSKYLFDYDKHRLTTGVNLSLFSADIHIFNHLVRPRQRNNYVTTDVRIAKEIKEGFSLFLEGTNIFNRGYHELTDVKAQGRWWQAGAQYYF
ncbi:MAG: TonB-dependent receptor [Candidatus Omnitrophica bacterium]|nr:TonB-dependent receptor [Candidatus Omnitrophota bacterium]